MSKRFERLFRLLDLVAEGRSNIHTLVTELRICERQVYRDLLELRTIGFDIEVDPDTGNYENGVCGQLLPFISLHCRDSIGIREQYQRP